MAFSDEPQVVQAGTHRSRKPLWLSLGVAAVLLVIIGAAAAGPLHAWRKEHAVHGPNHGTVYPVRIHGNAHTLEFARLADGSPAFFLEPRLPQPDSVMVRYWVPDAPGPEWEAPRDAVWNPDHQAYVHTGDRFHPNADVRKRAQILQGDAVLWSGTRWSYGESDHHHHH